METLTLSHLVCAHEVFHNEVTFFTWAAPQSSSIGDSFRRRVITIITCLTLKCLYRYIHDIRMIFIYL